MAMLQRSGCRQLARPVDHYAQFDRLPWEHPDSRVGPPSGAGLPASARREFPATHRSTCSLSMGRDAARRQVTKIHGSNASYDGFPKHHDGAPWQRAASVRTALGRDVLQWAHHQ